jgi:4-amino-4-deoxy-L-arabinose transferase-like glycosyltransferase
MNGRFRTRYALAAIFVLTLGTRFAFYASNPLPHTGPWVDGAMAHNIVDDGHWFQVNANAGPDFAFNAPLRNTSARAYAPDEADLKYADAHPRWEPFIWEPVGEAALLAGLWETLGSQSYSSDVLMKIVLDACAALLIYRIAMLLFKRRRAALAAALLYALYPPVAEVVVNPNRDFWSMDVTIAVLAVYLEAVNSTQPARWLAACGLVTGIGLYFDPNALFLPGALALATVTVTGWRSALQRAFLMTAIALLLSVPWMIRNYNDFHKFIPFHAGVGAALWQGLADLPNNYGPLRSDYLTDQLVHHALPAVRWESPVYDSYLDSRARSLIEEHPLFYLRVVAHRIWISTLGELDLEWARGKTTTPFAYARGPLAFVVEHPFQLAQVMLMPLVFLCAMLSLGFTWARYKRAHLLLVATDAVIALPYLIINTEGRYTMPLAISYAIWIALGADLLVERLGWKPRLDPHFHTAASSN